MNWFIVELEMVNILLSDNEVVVTGLRSDRAKDPFLGVCARNIWYASVLSDIDIQYIHIGELDNMVVDLLSRWTGSQKDFTQLHVHVQDPIWIPVNIKLLDIDLGNIMV